MVPSEQRDASKRLSRSYTFRQEIPDNHAASFSKGGSMRSINWGRVILGGLLAGVIINISEGLLNAKVLKEDWAAVMRTMGKTMEEGGSAMAVWIILGFVMGIAGIWLYAAIRPRFGPGAGTAVRAGIAFWFFVDLLSVVAQANMGMFPSKMLVTIAIWTLVQNVLALVVGAWLYKEEVAAA